MINAINDVLKINKLDEVKQASLKVEISKQQTQPQLQKRIVEFEGIGWICLTDKVLTIRNKADLSGIEGKQVLSAELAAGSKSLHIRQNGAVWDLFDMISTDGGEQYLVEEDFIATQSGMKLIYETYWQKDDIGTLIPFASRFAGFSNQGGGN